MKVKVPIGELDIEYFQDLVNDSDLSHSFTWTFETECGKPIDIVFIKDNEEDE